MTLIDADSVQPSAASVAAAIARGIAVLPALESASIARVWGGLIDMTPDGLPILGRVPEVEGCVACGRLLGPRVLPGARHRPDLGELVTAGQRLAAARALPLDRFAGAGGVAATTLAWLRRCLLMEERP